MDDPEFRSLLPHSIGIESDTGVDAWGNRTYGAKVLYAGRVQNKRRKVVDVGGHEVLSETTVYLATTSGISIHSRITLPSGCLPAQPPIISVYRVCDEYGTHHTQLYV